MFLFTIFDEIKKLVSLNLIRSGIKSEEKDESFASNLQDSPLQSPVVTTAQLKNGEKEF